MLGQSFSERTGACQLAPQNAHRFPETVGWSQRQLLPRQHPLSGFFQKRHTSIDLTSTEGSRDDVREESFLSSFRPFVLVERFRLGYFFAAGLEARLSLVRPSSSTAALLT